MLNLLDLKKKLENFCPQKMEIPGASSSAVFIPILGGEKIIFVRRSPNLKHHAGQIAFPGGKRDPGDATLEDTALRELQEEILISSEGAQILGRLSDHFTYVSNYIIAPFVGTIESCKEMKADGKEVMEILQIPIEHLLHPLHRRSEVWDYQGLSVEMIFFDYQDATIWGATARILEEFLKIVQES